MKSFSERSASLHRVTVEYPSGPRALAALSDVDLDLPRGAVTALVGPNGAGKTTLLRILAGLLPPSAGTVEVLGVEQPAQAGRRRSRELRRRLGYIPQELALDPEMTGREILWLLAALYGVPRAVRGERIARLGGAFGTIAHLPRPVAVWSGGLKRRLHLAAGMIHDPDLLLLDEPTAGLDPEGSDFLWAELERRARDGRAVAVVTHDLTAAERSADHVVLLDSGRIVIAGNPRQLMLEEGCASLAEVYRWRTGRDAEDLTPLAPLSHRPPIHRERGESNGRRRPSPGGWGGDGRGVGGEVLDVVRAVAWRTWLVTARRPVLLVFSLGQPLIWMLFFGFLFQRYQVVLPAGLSYLDFLAPGVSAMTVLFGASQVGIGWIRDLQTGFLPRMLNTPSSPAPILAGKLLADVTRLVLQAVAVLLVAVLLGARPRIAPGAFVLGLLCVALFGAAFGALSCAVALRARAQEAMATYVHLVNMPLLFTSTALVPRREMPAWLAAMARWNPLTLTVDAWRGALLTGETPPLATLLALAGLAAALSFLALAQVRSAAGVTQSAV